MRSKKILIPLAAAVAAAVLAGVGVSAIWSGGILADGTNLHLRVLRTSAFDFDSGWHMHPGIVIVQVEEGSIQFYQGSCTPRTVTAGQTFVEVPFQPIRAAASGKVVWTTTMLTRYEDPLTMSAANPCP